MIPNLPSPPSILLIQTLATAMMTGIIWFVQIVHYPLFTQIPKEGFTRYEQSHTVRTGWVVAPLMLLELGSALLLLIYRHHCILHNSRLQNDLLFDGCLQVLLRLQIIAKQSCSCKYESLYHLQCKF